MILIQIHSTDRAAWTYSGGPVGPDDHESMAARLRSICPGRILDKHLTQLGYEGDTLFADLLSREDLLARLNEIRPDILLIDKPVTFDGRFIDEMKVRPRMLIGWLNELPPKRCDLSAFDLVLVTSHLISGPAKRCGAVNAVLLRPGFPDQLVSLKPATVREHDVLFAGELLPGQTLTKHLTKLAQAPLLLRGEFDLIYHVFAEHLQQLPAGIVMYNQEPRWGDELFAAYTNTKIAIYGANDLIQAESGANLFLAAGAGALVIAENRGAIADIFTPDQEIITFTTPENLIDPIYHYLETPAELEAISRSGQLRCLEEHSLTNRVYALDALIKEFMKSSSSPSAVDAIVAKGEQLFEQGLTTEALAAFKQALELDGQNVVARVNLGVALWQTGQPQAALAQLQQAWEIEPSNHDATLNLADVLIALDLQARAQNVLLTHLETSPDNQEARARLDALENENISRSPEQSLALLASLSTALNSLEQEIKAKGGLSRERWAAWLEGLAKDHGEALAARFRGLGPEVLHLPRRLRTALTYAMEPLNQTLAWLSASRETTNFTYDLSQLNVQQLAAFISTATGIAIPEIFSYLNEILNDQALKKHVASLTANSPFKITADTNARYGRRIGWYAMVRATKPKIIIETGIDKGLGSCVLASALLRNASEGHPGRLYAIDINPQAGFLLKPPYAAVVELVYSDSIEYLKRFKEPIDIFIHDSDHAAEYEHNEFLTVCDKLAPDALIISDAAHHSDELLNFAMQTDRQYLYFQEKPLKHFYPGGGIGLAYKPRPQAVPSIQDFAYDDNYFDWQKAVGAFGGKANLFKFADYVKAEGNLIDFGCGGGYLLANLESRNKLGIEVNPHARQAAASLGIKTVASTADVPDDFADTLVSNHALEHIPDPLQTLRLLLPKLKEGGRAVFVVPHQDHREEFNPDDKHHHLYTWNRQTLGNLFVQAGFAVESVDLIQHMWPPDYLRLYTEQGEAAFHEACRVQAQANDNYQIRIVARRPAQLAADQTKAQAAVEAWGRELKAPIRLYVGDLPDKPEYAGLIGLSLTQNNSSHVRHDISEPLPLPDGCVESVQAEDVFEHLEPDRLPAIIDEIHRVLKPGGLLRLSVPDYGCDILRERSTMNSAGQIVHDPGGDNSTGEPGHLWFPRYDTVKALLHKTRFNSNGTVEFLHYYRMDGSFVTNAIDYSKGYIQRTPDHDERIQSPYRPMSMVIDMHKDHSCQLSRPETPVILIAYNRPAHTAQVLAALRHHGRNRLYIFCDAARTVNDQAAVDETRALIKAIDWCQPIVIEQTKNIGLANSIIGAADLVLKDHDQFILLEDDCVPGEYFFDYMEGCLERYRSDARIFGVSGYSVRIPDELLAGYAHDVYFTPRIGSWGWGTWKRAWNRLERNLAQAYTRAVEQGIDLNQGGNDIPAMLVNLISGRLKDVWTLHWVLTVYLNRGLYVYPTRSHISNIGMDGSGLHCGATDKFETLMATGPTTSFPELAQPDAALLAHFRSFYDRPQPARPPVTVFKADGRPLKVVQLCVSDSGGAGKAAYRLHRNLLESGVDSVMLVLNKQSADPSVRVIPTRITEPCASCDVPVFESPYWSEQNRRWHSLMQLYPERPKGLEAFTTVTAGLRLDLISEIHEADIINLHWVAGLLDAEIAATAFSGKHLVWTMHDMNPFTGGCHYAGECTKYLEQCRACPQLGSQELADLAALNFTQKVTLYSGLSLSIACPSAWLADCSRQSALLSRFQTTAIANGLPVEVFKPLERAGLKQTFKLADTAKVVLFGAQSVLNLRKGFDYLIDALASIAQSGEAPEIVLAFFGNFPEDASLKLPFELLKLGSIADEQQLAMAYNLADVFVIPSREDNLPNTVCEAMACGTPVVGFRVGGIGTMIEHAKTGYLAEAFDTRELAAGISWALNQPAAELRAACRQAAVARYAPQIQAQAYIKLYRETLAAAPHNPKAAALIEAGETAFTNGDLDGAIANFNQVLTLEPHNAVAHSDLGAAYWQQAITKALDHFQAALRLDSTNRDAALNLAEICRLLGDAAQARAVLEDYLKHAPDDSEAQELLTQVPNCQERN